ncbi:MAG: hypothetical protein JXD23_03520 [Spirochaetales bacterium]|nr:hypothetical protein [Spirochaetales bacterium]
MKTRYLLGIVLLTFVGCYGDNKSSFSSAREPEEAIKLLSDAEYFATLYNSKTEMIEKILVELETKYPDSVSAKKVPEFRKAYPAILQAAKDAEKKRDDEKKKIENEKKAAYNKFVSVVTSRSGYWNSSNIKSFYDQFTDEERDHILSGEVKIGDSRYVVSFLSGYYEMSKTETSFGTSYRYYGRSDECKYKYITTDTNSKVDYISQ